MAWFESFTAPTPKVPPVGPLLPGDILVKQSDRSLINMGITVAQSWSGAGAYSNYTHAGIAVSDRMIAEMDGKGLQHHDLAAANAGYTYAVYRAKFRDVARGAAETARMMFGFHDSGLVTYSTGGAAASVLLSRHKVSDKNRINTFLDKVLAGRKVDFFCSELVVFCYLVALEQSGLLPPRSRPDLPGLSSFFDYEPGEYSPAYLYEMLRKNQWFEFIGNYRGMRWS